MIETKPKKIVYNILATNIKIMDTVHHLLQQQLMLLKTEFLLSRWSKLIDIKHVKYFPKQKNRPNKYLQSITYKSLIHQQ